MYFVPKSVFLLLEVKWVGAETGRKILLVPTNWMTHTSK